MCYSHGKHVWFPVLQPYYFLSEINLHYFSTLNTIIYKIHTSKNAAEPNSWLHLNPCFIKRKYPCKYTANCVALFQATKSSKSLKKWSCGTQKSSKYVKRDILPNLILWVVLWTRLSDRLSYLYCIQSLIFKGKGYVLFRLYSFDNIFPSHNLSSMAPLRHARKPDNE